MTPIDPDFEVSFGGYPFLRPSPRVLEHCERYFDDHLPRLVQWPDPNVWAGGMGIGNLPLPPAPPRPRLNRFFYPYGMIRWGTFWGVMRGDDVAALALVCFASGGPVYADFLIRSRATGASSATDVVHTPMTMLPPYKIAQVETDSETLYLVTLVDERYERRTLRFVSTTQPTFAVPTEGDTETVDAAYSGLTLAGPAGSKAAGNENHSTLAEYPLYDHAAACLGMVWVRDFQPTGGKYLYRTRWETANALAHTDKVGAFADVTDRPLAGNAPVSFELAATTTSRKVVMPATVRVGFPSCRTQSTVTGTTTYQAGTTAGGQSSMYWRTVSAPVGLPVGQVLAAVTTMEPATYTTTPAPAGTPTNSATLTTLANQIGEDFYHALVGACEVVYAGLTPLNPRWACDFTIDFATYEGERTQTRIARDPFNSQYAVDLLLGKDLSGPTRTTSGPIYAAFEGDAFPAPVGGVPNGYVFPEGLYVHPGEKATVTVTVESIVDYSLGISSISMSAYTYNFSSGLTIATGTLPESAQVGTYQVFNPSGVSLMMPAKATTVFAFDNTIGTAKYAIGFKFQVNANGNPMLTVPFGIYTATFTSR